MVNIVELAGAVAILDRIAPARVVDRALREAGIDRTALEAGPGFLPYEIEAQFVEAAARSLDERHLGAKLAREFDYASYGAYARYVLGAPDLRSALGRGREAFSLLHRGSAIVLREEGCHLVVGRTCRLLPSVAAGRHLDEGAVLLIGDVIRHFLGPEWRPDWIEITGPGRGCADSFEEIAGAPVRTGARMPAVALRASELSAPNPCPPAARNAVTRSQLPSLMGVMQPNTLAEAVRGTLRAQLVQGDFSEDGVAHRLGIGPRTLQRGLKAEGTGFREIRRQFLEARARALLTDTQLPVEEIARSLGYAEPNSFRRAFRDWTGLSPSAYRAGGRQV